MSIEVLGRATTIHTIGESHAIQFNDLLFKPPQPDLLYLCKSRFFHHLPASYYLENGDFNPLLRAALVADGIFDDQGRANYMVRDWTADYMAGRAVLAPPMVFFAGDVDMQTVTFQTGATFDFELPGDPGYGVDFGKQPMSYASVRERIETLFAPYFSVLHALRALFPRTMAHALPPRTRDDDRAARWTGGVFPAAVRSKLIVVANQVLANGCAAIDVPFIDTWSQIALDGYLNPAFDLDGLHLNPQGASVSLEAIAAVLTDRTASTACAERYGQLKSRAPRFEGTRDLGLATWTGDGYALGDLGERAVAGFGDGLAFVEDPANPHAHPEWVGYPRAGRRGVAVAEPSAALLEAAARLFCVGMPRARLQVDEGKDLTIACFRPIRLAPGAATDAGVLPTPYGCRRAILCLDNAGSVITQATGGGEAVDHSARAGMLIVYDPARVRCRAAAGDAPARFVEMGLTPRYGGQPFRVAFTGLNDWPADPFSYRLEGVSAFPPFEQRRVNDWCYADPQSPA